jgi:hypothetical protein
MKTIRRKQSKAGTRPAPWLETLRLEMREFTRRTTTISPASDATRG